ncbi:PREDICTED: beta-galactosidase isoform X2 [Dinoponera quadriceps]|uniref:Beta-galactosidase n=1 Tax=Dinoponera quadriceps TaxID=609295 RepID=A0A6P3X6U3_DINQU|nr:PREDICTED: beta-galactosidase isoform X2 [Dinoponera quadriceps]
MEKLNTQYSFAIDYKNNQFLLDGKPFRYVSGSFHYFRAPRYYWRDRLRAMRAAGLNAVSTYVEWSLHEPERDEFNWSGDADIVEFLNIAQQEDLLVLLRPGPYICAERDMGGLPYWLLRDTPDMKLRTKDQYFMANATSYLTQLLDKVKPFLRGNGGPIIMVQVENEYGSFNACDTEYMSMLKNLFLNKIQNKALLYTTDGASESMLRCGSTPGVYATVDFGAGGNVTKSFAPMRAKQPKGPLVNSEYYPGWLTHWGESFQRVKTDVVTKTLKDMLDIGASVNIYMFYGGTNFALTSGANGGSNEFKPQITSYDYDAPLTEAGDPTEKYFALRNVIGQYLPLPGVPVPIVSPKGNYGPVLLEPISELLDNYLFVVSQSAADFPKTFEALSVNQGFVLYETRLPVSISDEYTLNATVKDRALVYVNKQLYGILSRTDKKFTLPLKKSYGDHLRILVENQGRVNFGYEIRDYKGVSNVNIAGVTLKMWNMTGYSFPDVSILRDKGTISMKNGALKSSPVFLRGHFTVTGQPLDTFLDTGGWGKGMAFVNGYNLGRYWPSVGPQITLYVPAPYLRTGNNELILLESEYVSLTRKMKFQSAPNLG